MLVEAQVSSIKTSRGSRLFCISRQAARASLTSGRSCSAACRVFFKRQLQMQQKSRDGRPPRLDPVRGDLLPQFGDRQVGFFRNKRPYLVLMPGQGIAFMAAEFSWLAVACCINPLHELDHTTRADIEHPRHLVSRLSGKKTPHNPSPQTLGKGLSLPGCPPPARRMNHDSRRLGIPSRFRLFGTRSSAANDGQPGGIVSFETGLPDIKKATLRGVVLDNVE